MEIPMLSRYQGSMSNFTIIYFLHEPTLLTSLPVRTDSFRRGSVVSSRLLDLTTMALIEGPELKEYTAYIPCL
ncbi:MAG: hypothetical protein D8M57_17815 [Candidatus Scalindua sp. AMX11]|nr:MAG: hypothetical protein D8M57_17815 [Candidatus Scalindua sp. AMX11]